MNNLMNQKGQLFVENMVAISIIIIGLLSVLALLSYSISFTRVVADQYIANNLAMEGIEIAKNRIDTAVCGGPSPGSWPGPSGLGDPSAVLYLTSGGGYALVGSPEDKTKFSREIRVANGSAGSDELVVTSIVEWENRAGSFDVVVEGHFYNWFLSYFGGDRSPTNCI